MPSKALRTDPTLRFEFHLARELHMTHEDLLRRMSGREFARWMALYRMEHAERQRAERDARGKSRARAMATRMRMGEQV